MTAKPICISAAVKPKVVKLHPSLTELASGLQTVSFLDAQGKPVPLAAPGKDPVLPEGYGEAPFVFKRAGKYYFVYSDGWAPSATQVYAIGDHPMGPFTYAGKVMEHAASVTQHGSVVQFKGKWYVLYHTSELSNGNAFRRSVCIDELTFDTNGRINTVAPTEERSSARSRWQGFQVTGGFTQSSIGTIHRKTK